MNTLPSSALRPVCRLMPKGLRPYTTPKFMILAMRRISSVTSSIGMSYTDAAVAEWMSSRARNASSRPGSLDRWARMRSSICE